MRRLGSILLIAGVVVGAGVGLALLSGVRIVGVPWIVAVGLTKLTLLTSSGLMAAGAVCLRLDRRAESRHLLSRGGDEAEATQATPDQRPRRDADV